MTGAVDLKVDWCSYEAAKYAVMHWHYSGVMPVGKLVKLGVWEDKKFIGCVLFSRGAVGVGNIGARLDLRGIEVTELTRIALTIHDMPVTRIVRVALSMLREQSPGLRLVVSYADPAQGHNGSIYQGGNWYYTGCTGKDVAYVDSSGRRWHSRLVSKKGYKIVFGKMRACPKIEEMSKVEVIPKHRYFYPLDRAMRRQIEPLRQPYPKRAGG